MRAILYLMVIVLANVVTAKFNPLQMGIFIIPWGTFLIGATFILRDLVQNKFGRTRTYIIIVSALALSAATSSMLGDTLWIVFASAISFAISETTDTEIYTRLKLSLAKRVFYSGTVGGILDSSIFVLVGLSPLGANFVPWNFVWEAILGQIIFKTIMQGIGVLAIKLATKKENVTC
jgi:uncharacterized PurR-regulated membrane protein YhhQ (DUF165 family)